MLLKIDDAEWHVLKIDVGRRKKSEVAMFEQELWPYNDDRQDQWEEEEGRDEEASSIEQVLRQ